MSTVFNFKSKPKPDWKEEVCDTVKEWESVVGEGFRVIHITKLPKPVFFPNKLLFSRCTETLNSDSKEWLGITLDNRLVCFCTMGNSLTVCITGPGCSVKKFVTEFSLERCYSMRKECKVDEYEQMRVLCSPYILLPEKESLPSERFLKGFLEQLDDLLV